MSLCGGGDRAPSRPAIEGCLSVFSIIRKLVEINGRFDRAHSPVDTQLGEFFPSKCQGIFPRNVAVTQDLVWRESPIISLGEIRGMIEIVLG